MSELGLFSVIVSIVGDALYKRKYYTGTGQKSALE